MKNIKIVNLLFGVVLIAGMLAGCAAPAPQATTAPATEQATQAPATEAPVATAEPSAAPIIITDALDRTVEFDKLPTRILIAGKAGFMLANAAFLFPEAPERLIGYVPGSQTANDFIKIVFTQTSNLAHIETTSTAEQIAPLNPDLVLLKSYLKNSLGDQIEQLGIKVIYLNLETPEAISKDIRTLGGVFGDSARADQLISLYDAATKKITDVTSGLTEEQKPSVLVLQYSDKGGEIAFKVPPIDWLQTGVIEMAGGMPVWKDVPTDGWTTVSLEQIASWNPQIILLVDYKGNALEIVNQLKTDDKWALLDAVKNSKLYAFPLDFQSWDQPDTRWTVGLTWVATKLHPDLFSSVVMVNEIKSFYKDFYGLSDSVIQEKVIPLVKGDL